MNKNNWLILQGQSNFPFTRDVIDFYAEQVEKGLNLVWSTWREDIDMATFAYAHARLKHVIAPPQPKIKGRANLNLQCQSTINGVNYIFKLGDFDKINDIMIFKSRTDLLVPKMDRLFDRLNENYLASLKPNLLCWDNKSECMQIGDLMMHGSIHDTYLFWDLDPQLTIEGFAERILVHEYMRKRSIRKYEMTYESMSEYFNWIMKEVFELGITVDWLKYPDRSPLNRHLSDGTFKW
jgi:hypothetical protein